MISVKVQGGETVTENFVSNPPYLSLSQSGIHKSVLPVALWENKWASITTGTEREKEESYKEAKDLVCFQDQKQKVWRRMNDRLADLTVAGEKAADSNYCAYTQTSVADLIATS